MKTYNQEKRVEPLRCGIVGYGYMGEIRRRVIQQHPRLSLVGICEENDSIRKNIEGYPTFKSFDDLLVANPDILFICTPNKFIPDYCMKGLRSGKHVFCEKPPGRTLQDIKDMQCLEKENPDVKLMFGFNHRFHPAILYAKKIIEKKGLGNIISIRGIYGKSGGNSFKTSWRNIKEISGGGILLDQGIHMLDLFRFFCGDFEYVKCFASSSYWKFDVEDNAYVVLQSKEGKHALFHSSATMWKHTFKIDITLEDGYITIEGLLSKSGSYGKEKITIGRRQFEDEALAIGNPKEEVIYFDKDDSWNLEVEEFVRCIDSDAPITMSSSDDALRAMEIVEKAYVDSTPLICP